VVEKFEHEYGSTVESGNLESQIAGLTPVFSFLSLNTTIIGAWGRSLSARTSSRLLP
jgi:hypothetical protein